MGANRVVTVRLSDEDYDALRALAFYTGSSMTALLRQGVRFVLTESDLDATIDQKGERFRARIEKLR